MDISRKDSKHSTRSTIRGVLMESVAQLKGLTEQIRDAALALRMVEKLTDPLTHIVRNAIDHGIEPVNVRRQRSTSDTGTLRLTACHDSGNIVIEISDDDDRHFVRFN